MRIPEAFGWDRWPRLKAPARRVTDTMLQAMRWMDTCKEWVLIKEGMPMTSNAIHQQAHKYGEYWDKFGDILHQRNLLQEFPGTPELDEEPDLDRAFEIMLMAMEEIEKALGDAIVASDEENLYALGREMENLQIETSRDYTKWIQAAQMWGSKEVSKTSFERWISALFDGEEEAE